MPVPWRECERQAKAKQFGNRTIQGGNFLKDLPLTENFMATSIRVRPWFRTSTPLGVALRRQILGFSIMALGAMGSPDGKRERQVIRWRS
jgi:hypothetical protein